MPELPDYRAEPMSSPEGEGRAAARWAAWAGPNLDPHVEAHQSGRDHWDNISTTERDRMAARVIQQSELIGFWLAWHRAGGFAELERGGWDRSTIFRKIRRFRAYYGIHPDDARFPWLDPDFERAWSGDRQLAFEWVGEYGQDLGDDETWKKRWRPAYAYRRDPHVVEPDDPFAELLSRSPDPQDPPEE